MQEHRVLNRGSWVDLRVTDEAEGTNVGGVRRRYRRSRLELGKLWIPGLNDVGMGGLYSGIALQGGHQLAEPGSMQDNVLVEKDDVTTAGESEPDVVAGAIAVIAVEPVDRYPLIRLRQLRRAIGRAVVHDDHFERSIEVLVG